MRRVTPDTIDPATRAWFGNQIQSLAMRHELTGPDIRRVNAGDYKKQLVAELRSRAQVAAAAKELVVGTEELSIYCSLAAEELIRTRQIRAAHKDGELPTEALRQLPAYAAFPDYFDENPSVVLAELLPVVREQWSAAREDGSSEPLSQPEHPTYPLSKQTREWLEMQVLGLACADDAWGAPFGSVPQEPYITDSALRIRDNARRAIRMGELHVHCEDVDKICWVAACEAFLLRSLKAAKDAGELPESDIKRMPIYGTYKDYFEKGLELATAAKVIAAAAGLPIQMPDETK